MEVNQNPSGKGNADEEEGYSYLPSTQGRQFSKGQRKFQGDLPLPIVDP